jgi:hypothetical protein
MLVSRRSGGGVGGQLALVGGAVVVPRVAPRASFRWSVVVVGRCCPVSLVEGVQQEWYSG